MVSGMQESDADNGDRLTAGRERPKAALFDLDGALADISLLPVMHPGDPRTKELQSRPDHHRVVPAHDWVVARGRATTLWNRGHCPHLAKGTLA